MPSTRTSLFLDALQQSGLLEPGQIDEFVWERGLQDERAGKLARAFVQDEKLTLFQARQLLQGRWRNLVIGDYRILHLLSQGGIGRVFLASNANTKRRCVIKVLRERQRRRRESVERFRLEAFACMRLDHPNLVRGREYSAIDDGEYPIHYLAMDLVKGPNLHEMYAMKGRYPWRQACEIVRQIAVALGDVHANNFVHRDVKPPNVLLAPDGNAKLIDFGLAWYSGTDKKFKIPTNRRVGTTGFIAPEQSMRGKDVDARADIYGLGCTLFFALTAKLPKLNRDKNSKSRGSVQLAPLDDVSPKLPEALKAIVRRMVARKASDRFASAEEVVDALEPFSEPFTMNINFYSLLKARDKARSEHAAPVKPPADIPTAGVSAPEALTRRDPVPAPSSQDRVVASASADIGVSEFDDRPDMVAKIEELTKRLAASQRETAQAWQEVAEIQAKFATAETAWADEIAEVREELETSNRERDSLATELSETTSQTETDVHNLHDQLASLATELSSLQKTNETLEQARAQLAAEKDREIAELRAVVEQLTQQTLDYQATVASLSSNHESELRSLREERDASVDHAAELRQAQETLERVHAQQVVDLRAELANLQEDLGKANTTHEAARDSHRAEVERLQSVIARQEHDHETEAQKEKQRRASHVAELGGLQQEAEQLAERLNKQLSDQADFVAQLKKKDEASTLQIQQLQAHIASLQQELVRSQQKGSELAEELRRAGEMRAAADSDLAAARDLLLAREAELATALRNVDALTADLHASRERMQDYLATMQGDGGRFHASMDEEALLVEACESSAVVAGDAVADSLIITPSSDDLALPDQESIALQLSNYRDRIRAVAQEIAALSNKARNLANDIEGSPVEELYPESDEAE